MIKVRILTSVTAAGAAALAIPSLAGCSTEAASDVDTGSQNNTESVAGSGSLILHGWSLNYQSTSGGDEFVRVGEKLKVQVDFNELVNQFLALGDPDDQSAMDAIRNDPSKLQLTAKVTYTLADETPNDQSYTMSVAAGAGGVQVASSPEFVVPKSAKHVSVDIIANYTTKTGDPATKSILAGHGLARDFVVFGAFLPNKLALFDTMGSDKRTRIVEGGSIVPGSQVLVSVTDWRLDTIVDKTSFDLRFGDQYSGSRFGPMVVPALGELQYEVTAQVSTDGGSNYQPSALTKQMRPDVIARDVFRYAFQAELDVPQGAGPSVKIAFHVKAFLQVPDYRPGSIMNAKYAPGTRILLKDTWDNNEGKDYALPVGND